MIKVYIEFGDGFSRTARGIAMVTDEEVYAAITPALEAYAEKQGGFITESLEEDEDFNEVFNNIGR